MSELRIKAGGALSGTMRVPGDKSISHRSVMLSAIARNETVIKGLLHSEDVKATISAFRAMGVKITEEDDRVVVYGKGESALKDPKNPLDLGNSGTSMRLLSGLFCGLPVNAVLTGDASLLKRPMSRVMVPLSQMGADISGSENDAAPLVIHGKTLSGIRYELPMASAQVKSAVLLAGLFAKGETWVKEPAVTRDHTEKMLAGFGVDVLRKDGWVGVPGQRGLTSIGEIEVPGDISSAAFFMVAATIVPGSALVIENVGINPTRTGVIDALCKMGADITIINERKTGDEPSADLKIKHSKLHGIDIGMELVPRSIDELPALCIAAACASGKTVIKDAQELRVKESDRIKSMYNLLSSMGVKVIENPDGLEITGGGGLRATVVDCEMDHRIGMAAAIAGLMTDGETIIKGAQCIATSFPDFGPGLTEVSKYVMKKGYVIAIDGPSGAGKSTVARALANKLEYRYIDTGAMYRAAALAADKEGIDISNFEELLPFLERLTIRQKMSEGAVLTFLSEEDVSQAIRKDDVSMKASAISALPPVRERLTALQRKMGEEGKVVMEGRDIGTVVFPDADFKIFLTASPQLRSKRRFDELKQKGEDVKYEKVLEQVKQRDHNDSMREIAPLRPAPDSIEVDSTNLTIDQVVEKILRVVDGN